MLRLLFLLLFSTHPLLFSSVRVGADLLFEPPYFKWIQGKKIGLLTNHTSLNSQGEWILDRCLEEQKRGSFRLAALFTPEHGLKGHHYAEEECQEKALAEGVPIHSLYGQNRRPTPEMLQGIDLLVFDMQDIGSRSYTYVNTLFYAMEEAAKAKIPVIVLDRPNPINGSVVDGPMLQPAFRSFVGYINVPYCHGMTVGELAQFFNKEYRVGCNLRVVPMQGWTRTMTFADTHLPWIPTSPQIPDLYTPLYYPMTGILGELQIVNIGVGYTLPFRVVGAPWIHADSFAKALNDQKLPGILFRPFSYRPFFGKFAHTDCHGVFLLITDPLRYQPVAAQYLLIGILKSLYPKQFAEALKNVQERKKMFCQVNGSEEVWNLLHQGKYITWKLRGIDKEERIAFLEKRKKYLFSDYTQKLPNLDLGNVKAPAIERS